MRVAVTTELRLYGTPDGTIWTRGRCPYSFWVRYLSIFDDLVVLARVENVMAPRSDWSVVQGPGVSVAGLPSYNGPVGYVRQRRAFRSALLAAIGPNDATVFRVPGVAPMQLCGRWVSEGRPYGLEVIGDPLDVFARGGIVHPLRPLFRQVFTRQLAMQCRNASAVAYMSMRVLPIRYPARAECFVTSYADTELGPGSFVCMPRSYSAGLRSVKLVCVGTFAQPYKGQDVLVHALASCLSRGLDMRVTFVGDGAYLSEVANLAGRLGCAPRVKFTGYIGERREIEAFLDEADIFVLPSRTEGLPGALLEAMARALPCTATNVGGIPDLLDQEVIVPPGDSGRLAEVLSALADSPGRLAAQSAANLLRARDFSEDRLQMQRADFLRHVRDVTQACIKQGA